MSTNSDKRSWSSVHPYAQVERPSTGTVVSQIIDFTKQTSTLAAQTGAIAADTIKVLDIPAGSFVLGVRLKVLTIDSTATCTVGLGDSSAPSTYLAAQDIHTLTDQFSFNATTSPTNGVGKFYAAADYILMTCNHTAQTGKLQVTAVIVDLTGGGR